MKPKKIKRDVLALLLAAGYAGSFLTGCNFFKPDTDEEAKFDQDLFSLALTEINYNPVDNDAWVSDSLEFIEMKNTGTKTLKLASLDIGGSITYAFPKDSTLAGGGFYVVASNAKAFESRYGFAPDGVYTGQLGNSHGTITLSDVDFQETIFSQFYSDSGAWSGKADGGGYSLVTVDSNPDRTKTGPEAWKKSAQRNGSPGKDDIVIEVDSTLFNIRISEINYNPLDMNGIDGDSLEFIEVKNVGNATVNTGRLAFTNGIEYSFPDDSKIDAGKTAVIVSNINEFMKRYPEVTPLGEYNGQLSNGGEKVTLFDVQGDVAITTVDYKDGSPWPSLADGDGATLVAIDPKFNDDQNNPTMWRMSYRPDGTPGSDDPGVVVINEVLTHTDTPLVDAIELYNPGNAQVNISGWYLSDSKANPAKYRIPDGTTVDAGGYIVFDEHQFNDSINNPLAFTFNSHGETVWIFSHELGCDEGYCDGVTVGEIDNGVSVGLYRNSRGKEMWVRQKALTLGEANAGPRVGPLIISEIMYHSPGDTADFVEVTNISGGEVFLSHPDIPDFTWKIDGIKFSFPPSKSIRPNESVVIASDTLTEDAFRAKYAISSEVQVFQMQGSLQNGSEKLDLMQPADPFVEDSAASPDSTFPYVSIELIDYSDHGDWPDSADGLGKSLQRIATDTFGNDPISWKAADPTPGKME